MTVGSRRTVRLTRHERSEWSGAAAPLGAPGSIEGKGEYG